MTALNIATDVPSQINTLEKLAVWAITTLNACNPSLEVVEGQGYVERAAQAGIFYVKADSKHRFLGRASVQMSSEYLAGGSKTWNYAQELSNTPIPAAYKSN